MHRRFEDEDQKDVLKVVDEDQEDALENVAQVGVKEGQQSTYITK